MNLYRRRCVTCLSASSAEKYTKEEQRSKRPTEISIGKAMGNHFSKNSNRKSYAPLFNPELFLLLGLRKDESQGREISDILWGKVFPYFSCVLGFFNGGCNSFVAGAAVSAQNSDSNIVGVGCDLE